MNIFVANSATRVLFLRCEAKSNIVTEAFSDDSATARNLFIL